MRDISNTLLAAQKSVSQIPYVKVEVVEKIAGVARLNWSRLYGGSEPDYHHAATMPEDGSLIRARIDPASFQLYYQRVTNPGPGSNFSVWSGLGAVSGVSGVALCSNGTEVLLLYVGTDQRTVYVRESNDNGASFSAPVVITTAASPVGWLTAGIGGGGVATLFYSVGSMVYATSNGGGVWAQPTAWSNSTSSITGLACVYQGDWNLVLTGADMVNRYKVWTCVYGDGYSQSAGTWSGLAELAAAEANSGVEFHCPSVGFPDVFRVLFIEKYTGNSPYSRPFWAHAVGTANFIDNLWREPVPFDLFSSYGLALAYSSTGAWLSTPSGVWYASVIPNPADLSGDVIRLGLAITPGSGRLEVELRNDDGRYSEIGSGSYAAIQPGSEILVSPGCVTPSGQEVSAGLAYWIEGWEYRSGAAGASIVLYARDGWGLLGHWKARRQYTWTAGDKNIFQLLSFILGRAGLELSCISSSSALVNQYPFFTIHAGESGAAAINRLLDMVPDVIVFSGNYATALNPRSTDASAYSYGTDHPVLKGHYRADAAEVNCVQVFGNGLLSESFDWAGVSTVYDRLRQINDLNLDTIDRARERGEAELHEESMKAVSGEIVTPVNCAQELYDVVDVTDSLAGLSAARRRVLGIDLRYSAREGLYYQKLTLGGV